MAHRCSRHTVVGEAASKKSAMFARNPQTSLHESIDNCAVVAEVANKRIRLVEVEVRILEVCEGCQSR